MKSNEKKTSNEMVQRKMRDASKQRNVHLATNHEDSKN